MESTKDFVDKFNRAIFQKSGGDINVNSKTDASIESWFPSLKVDNVTMNGWFIVMKYRPHLSGNSLDKQQRRNVELEVRGDGGGVYRHPKMKVKEVPPIIVNDIRDGDTYAYAHIPLTTPLRLDVPFDQQSEVFEEIVSHVRTLTTWYRSAILNVDF
jgi:hypothetical protein